MSNRRAEINGSAQLDEKPLDVSCDKIQHPLYGHGVCKWPGCEAVCDEYAAFLK